MKFKATKQQVLEIAASAVNASIPVGMGLLHYEERDYTPAEMEEFFNKNYLAMDYVHGRMVKMGIEFFPDEGVAEINDLVHQGYQSWARWYPTVLDLVKSVMPDVEVV